jgi:DNA polymerase-2
MCPVSATKKLERIRTRKLGEQQLMQVEKLEGLLKSDIGFVRVVSVNELDSKPEYVYCFQLDKNEMPGFFTGDGLIFAHNCFGYLGHANAKFGRIDAHIAVCAWDREILLSAVRVAEGNGFRVLHGIVDSLWVKKEGASYEEYRSLKDEIEARTKFDLSFEGVYKWIVFLPSKMNPYLPVANRYFGAYRDGRLKVRGIEARRHDTPILFKKCQMEILKLLAEEASSIEEAKTLVPRCLEIVEMYANAILKHEVPPSDLVITRNISKAPSEYKSNTLEASATSQLTEAGRELHAGESIGYVITSNRSTARRFRTVPEELITENTRFDAERYVELLRTTCNTVIEPFA